MIIRITMLTCCVCMLVISTVCGQVTKSPQPAGTNFQVKDFFWPAADKNKASFYLPGKNGVHTAATRTIYYTVSAPMADTVKPVGTEVKIIDTAKIKKTTATAAAKTKVAPAPMAPAPIAPATDYAVIDIGRYADQVINTEKLIVHFTATDVQVTRSTLTNPLEINSVRDYDPPMTLLRLPKAGQKAGWTYTDRSGTTYKCLSEWMTVPVDGTPRKTIKVTVTNADEQGDNVNKTLLYYVQGVGLWKTELIKASGDKEVKDEFAGLDTDNVPEN